MLPAAGTVSILYSFQCMALFEEAILSAHRWDIAMEYQIAEDNDVNEGDDDDDEEDVDDINEKWSKRASF